MIRMVHKYPNQVTIIGDGPMTNIALAIKLDYEFASLAKEIVFMAGSFQPRALNDEFAKELTYTPRLEFNFQWDAEAARIMLHAPWKKITCVPNDATCVTLLDNALLKEASTSPTPWSDYLLHHVAPNYPLWDEASVAVWLDPTIIKKSSTLLMDVDASYGPGYGNTLSWPEGYGPGLGERTVTVVWEMDVPKLNQLYVNCMRAIK
jgi:inosine-uridine nucleoside N-ribohydrolase